MTYPTRRTFLEKATDMPTRPARSHHTGRLLTAVIMCVELAACQSHRAPRDPDLPALGKTATAAANGPSPTASATTRPSRIFRATSRPCDLVDHQLLARLFGPDSDDVIPSQFTQNKLMTTMVCNRRYGQRGDDTIVSVRIALADPAAVEAQYQGLRNLHTKRASLTDVPWLGQGAYTYIDQSLGPQLALYDANAYLTIGAVPVTGSPKPPTQTLAVLIETANKVLNTLPT